MTGTLSACSVLTFTKVTAGYGSTPVVHDLTFDLKSGEGACLMGPNGSGKSTILRCVIRLADICNGSVSLCGRIVSSIHRSDFARLGVGYVPQGRGDLPSLTVEENIRLAASCGGGSPQATTIESVFNSLPQIAAIRAQYVGKLSGGERTLVAFARAIALRPNLRLLLLDELSSSLSLTNARVVASLLANLRQEGTAILLAEQNIAFAQSLGIRLLKPNWQFGRG